MLGFLGLAMVGWNYGLTPLTCGLRALGGAAVLYVLAKFAGRILAGVLADAIVRGPAAHHGQENPRT